jgi:hypothetical protein
MAGRQGMVGVVTGQGRARQSFKDQILDVELILSLFRNSLFLTKRLLVDWISYFVLIIRMLVNGQW